MQNGPRYHGSGVIHGHPTILQPSWVDPKHGHIKPLNGRTWKNWLLQTVDSQITMVMLIHDLDDWDCCNVGNIWSGHSIDIFPWKIGGFPVQIFPGKKKKHWSIWIGSASRQNITGPPERYYARGRHWRDQVDKSPQSWHPGTSVRETRQLGMASWCLKNWGIPGIPGSLPEKNSPKKKFSVGLRSTGFRAIGPIKPGGVLKKCPLKPLQRGGCGKLDADAQAIHLWNEPTTPFGGVLK